MHSSRNVQAVEQNHEILQACEIRYSITCSRIKSCYRLIMQPDSLCDSENRISNKSEPYDKKNLDR